MASADLDEIYGEAILDHCRHPRNPDVLDHPDLSGQAVNPFCGDEVELQLVLDSRRVSRVGAQGKGCSINQAASSMLSDALAGKTLDEIDALAELFRSMMSGAELSDEELARLGELGNLSGVRQFPVRIKCALLSLSALEDGVEEYRAESGE